MSTSSSRWPRKASSLNSSRWPSSTASPRGIVFRVATAEDLIVMKAIALRPRDVADIEALLDMHPQLDFERIRYYLRAFTEALEADDFAAEFERLLARQQRRK